MRLTMKARQEVTKATAGQYRGASKKEKSKILDQFIATTAMKRAARARLNRAEIEILCFRINEDRAHPIRTNFSDIGFNKSAAIEKVVRH